MSERWGSQCWQSVSIFKKPLISTYVVLVEPWWSWAAHNPHEIWYKQIALESFLHVPLSPQPSPQQRQLQYIAPHRTNTENFSTVQSKSFWSSELMWIIILLLVIGEVYCRIFKLQKNYLSKRKDMFALEIILHLLDFAFGFCCCFIYISALSNTLLHMIEQVRKISIEGKHLEGRLWVLW